ncbi:MAG: PEP-CTERM sorting domain-containing protein [Pyrinomonadaceae bacterium]
MSLRQTLFASLLLTIVSGAGAAPAYAGAVQLTSAAQLDPGAVVVTYPAELGDFPASPLSLSAGGDTLLLSSAGLNFERFTSDGVTYDFPVTTTLLDIVSNGPLTMSFGNGALELGLRAQNNFPGSDTFSFTAYSGASLLGSFSVGPTAEGLSSFIGVRATAGDVITRLVISGESSTGINNDFSFGPISFVAAPEPVPEPATMILLGTGLAGVAAKARKRRAQAR